MRTVGIGFYWDDLTVGETFKTLNRTITEADIVGFIGVTGMVVRYVCPVFSPVPSVK